MESESFTLPPYRAVFHTIAPPRATNGPRNNQSRLADEEKLMRKDVEINAEGTILRGWFYTPDRASGKAPAIVMAHGFSAVKEMYLDRYAEHFCAAGLAAVVFDNRNFGASDGKPRQEIDPWAQVRDYRHAITWTRTQREVNPERIGGWGSSYSGG